MGTRALISINEKPYIATHWDGDPESLGADLLTVCITDNKNFKRDIIKVANYHTIDAADLKDEFFEKVQDERFKQISKKTKGKYSVAALKKLEKEGQMITFSIMCAGDYSLSSIENYGDWAEYQYDLTDGKWRYRELSGSYPKSLEEAGKLTPLTESVVSPANKK